MIGGNGTNGSLEDRSLHSSSSVSSHCYQNETRGYHSPLRQSQGQFGKKTLSYTPSRTPRYPYSYAHSPQGLSPLQRSRKRSLERGGDLGPRRGNARVPSKRYVVYNSHLSMHQAGLLLRVESLEVRRPSSCWRMSSSLTMESQRPFNSIVSPRFSRTTTSLRVPRLVSN